MTKLSLIALAALSMSFAAHAADPAATAVKPPQAVPVVAPAAPSKSTAHSQQDRMRECNKQATGKKGAERKAFMKTCLSKKA